MCRFLNVKVMNGHIHNVYILFGLVLLCVVCHADVHYHVLNNKINNIRKTLGDDIDDVKYGLQDLKTEFQLFTLGVNSNVSVGNGADRPRMCVFCFRNKLNR